MKNKTNKAIVLVTLLFASQTFAAEITSETSAVPLRPGSFSLSLSTRALGVDFGSDNYYKPLEVRGEYLLTDRFAFGLQVTSSRGIGPVATYYLFNNERWSVYTSAFIVFKDALYPAPDDRSWRARAGFDLGVNYRISTHFALGTRLSVATPLWHKYNATSEFDLSFLNLYYYF